MRWRVYQLRRRGRRVSWREVQRRPFFEGELGTYYLMLKTERVFVASLVRERAKMSRMLPDLYEPVLVTLADDVIILRGFEKVGDGDTAYAVVQEWRCEALLP